MTDGQLAFISRFINDDFTRYLCERVRIRIPVDSTELLSFVTDNYITQLDIPAKWRFMLIDGDQAVAEFCIWISWYLEVLVPAAREYLLKCNGQESQVADLEHRIQLRAHYWQEEAHIYAGSLKQLGFEAGNDDQPDDAVQEPSDFGLWSAATRSIDRKGVNIKKAATRQRWLITRLRAAKYVSVNNFCCTCVPKPPAYKTLMKWFAGKTTNKTEYVRQSLSAALDCSLNEVPE